MQETTYDILNKSIVFIEKKYTFNPILYYNIRIDSRIMQCIYVNQLRTPIFFDSDNSVIICKIDSLTEGDIPHLINRKILVRISDDKISTSIKKQLTNAGINIVSDNFVSKLVPLKPLKPAFHHIFLDWMMLLNRGEKNILQYYIVSKMKMADFSYQFSRFIDKVILCMYCKTTTYYDSRFKYFLGIIKFSDLIFYCNLFKITY